MDDMGTGICDCVLYLGYHFLVFLVLLVDASVEDVMLMSRTDLFGRPNSHLFTVDANLIMWRNRIKWQNNRFEQG